MKHLILLISALFILSGCGGGSSGGSSGSSGDIEVPMTLNQPYTVNSGDRIEKTSADSVVNIKHIDGHTESTVTLIAGSAKIIRKH